MLVQKRHINTLGMEVSCIGLGTVKFGRNQGVKYPSSFQLPTDTQIASLLERAQSYGINLLDTAPAYGCSEQRLGKLLSPSARSKWLIATKVGEEFEAGQSLFDFSPTHIERSVERSLRRLNTDYLDIVLVHSDGEDRKRIKEDKVLESLVRLKQKGVVRAIGMSTKTVAGGCLALDEADIVMVTYNPLEQDESEVIDKAWVLGKGVLVKKAFASGHLSKFDHPNPVQLAVKFVLSHPGVTSLITGTLNPAHLKETVSYCMER